MMSPVRDRSINPTGSAAGEGWSEFFQDETTDDGETRITRTVLTIGGRTMTQVTKRERHGRQMVLFGNLEVADIEMLPPPRFEEKVRRALAEGTAGPGRGFVLMPSASPYGREPSPFTLPNYETILRLAGAV